WNQLRSLRSMSDNAVFKGYNQFRCPLLQCPPPQDRRRWKQIESAIGREDWKQARKLIRMWLRRSPKSHWLLTRMGLTYYEQRQYRRALAYERRALRIAPRCPPLGLRWNT